MKSPKATAVAHPDLTQMAVSWLAACHTHRETSGLFGKVSVTIHRTPAGTELQLVEETTFKRAGRLCPYQQAVAWMAKRQAARAKDGNDGKMLLETDYKNGGATWAKVLEVTVISRLPLDAASGGG